MAGINETLKKRVAELEERIDYLYEENTEFKKKIENLNDKILDIMRDHIKILKDYYELKNNNENTTKEDLNVRESVASIDNIKEDNTILTNNKVENQSSNINKIRTVI